MDIDGIPLGNGSDQSLDSGSDVSFKSALLQELKLVNDGTPENPEPGTLAIYSKQNNKLYTLDSDGKENEVGSSSTVGGSSIWLFSDQISGPTALYDINFNNSIPANVTEIAINKTDFNSVSQAVLLGSLAPGDQLFLTNDIVGAKLYTLVSTLGDLGNYFVYTVTLESQDSPANYAQGSGITVDAILQNPWNQSLNTTNIPTFAGLTLNGSLNSFANEITTSYIPVNDVDLTNKLFVNQQDTLLQNQITSNDTDILALQNEDINLQNQITLNDTDITALQNTDTSLQSQIDTNDGDILALQNEDVNLQTQITDLQDKTEPLSVGNSSVIVDDDFTGATLLNSPTLTPVANFTPSSGYVQLTTNTIDTFGAIAYTGPLSSDYWEIDMDFRMDDPLVDGKGTFIWITVQNSILPDTTFSPTSASNGYSFIIQSSSQSAYIFHNTGGLIGAVTPIPGGVAANVTHNMKVTCTNNTDFNIIINNNTIYGSPVVDIDRGPYAYYGVAAKTGNPLSQAAEYRLERFKASSGVGGAVLTVNSNIIAPAIQLPGGDIQTQIDNATSGTSTGLDLKMDKVATTNLEMSGLAITNAGGISCSGTVTTANIIPSGLSGTSNIGQQVGNKYRSLYLSEGVYCQNIDCGGNILTGNLIPKTTDKDLGTTVNKYRNAYLTGTLNTDAVVLPSGDLQTQLTTFGDKTQNITAVSNETTLAGKLVVSEIEGGGSGAVLTTIFQDLYDGVTPANGGVLFSNVVTTPAVTGGHLRLMDDVGGAWGVCQYPYSLPASNEFVIEFNWRWNDAGTLQGTQWGFFIHDLTYSNVLDFGNLQGWKIVYYQFDADRLFVQYNGANVTGFNDNVVPTLAENTIQNVKIIVTNNGSNLEMKLDDVTRLTTVLAIPITPRTYMGFQANSGGGASTEYIIEDLKVTAVVESTSVTVNANMVVNGGIELPGGDIQGQIDALSGGTTTDLALKMDKVATTALNMSGFGISNVGILNSTTCNASAVNVSGAMTCSTLQASNGILGSALSSTGGDITVNGGIIKPFTTSITDLGSNTLKFRDAYLSGTANANAVVLPGGDVQTQLGTKFNTSATQSLGMNQFDINNVKIIAVNRVTNAFGANVNMLLTNTDVTFETGAQVRAVVSNTGMTINDNLVVNGNITKSYAFANWSNNALLTPLPNIAAYFPIVGNTQVVANQMNSTDMAVVFTNNIPIIEYNGTVPKVFQVSASIASEMENKDEAEIEYRLYKNGVLYPPSCVRAFMDGNDLDPTECTMNTLVELSNGDNIIITARNITTTKGIFVNCLNFVVTQI